LRMLPTALLPPFPARRWPATYLRRRSLRPTSAAAPHDLLEPPPPEPYRPRRRLPCPTGAATARVLLAPPPPRALQAPPPHEPYRRRRPPSPTGAAAPRILPEPPNPRSSSPARRQAPWEAARVQRLCQRRRPPHANGAAGEYASSRASLGRHRRGLAPSPGRGLEGVDGQDAGSGQTHGLEDGACQAMTVSSACPLLLLHSVAGRACFACSRCPCPWACLHAYLEFRRERPKFSSLSLCECPRRST
jgi:hypothetical protein